MSDSNLTLSTKGHGMKMFHVFLTGCFSIGLVSVATAQGLDNGPYEQQLRPYSEYHGDVKAQMEAENEKKRTATEQLKITGMQLEEEHNYLQTDIEEKETSIEKLKTVNEKLQAAQAVMHNQYVELEGLFKEQKVENDRLKEELETSKTAFYSKMLEFYQQEDEILTEQIAVLQERQKDIQLKIQDMQENLEIGQQD